MKDIYLFLDNIRSAYNVGAIFRTAEAVGVKKIYLAGISGVEKFSDTVKLNPKVEKTALEGINLNWEYVADPLTKLSELKSRGVQIVSLELTPKSIDFRKMNYQFPLCLVVGHERVGVNDKINQIADQVVQIPMKGKGRSLNVAIATAIALYEISR